MSWSFADFTRTSQIAAAITRILSILEVARDSSIRGFENSYRLTFFGAIGALIVGAFLPGWPGNWGGRGFMQTPPPSGS